MEQYIVLPVRKGGLGNQMFQVAAAIVYAEETNRTILLPKEFYNLHNRSHQDYGETVFREIQQRISVAIDGTMIEKLLRQGFLQHPGEPGFEDWTPINGSGNILLHGYFQNYPPIGRHEGLIRNLYLQGLSDFRSLYPPCSTRIGLHVRRGDYLQSPYSDVLPVQPLSYYEQAFHSFPFSIESFEVFIFSDDMDWCKQQALFQNLPKKVFVEEVNDVKALAMMTSCMGGFICGNSTFSWWGAFLGCFSEKRPVVVPKKWFKDPVGNLFPPEWICI